MHTCVRTHAHMRAEDRRDMKRRGTRRRRKRVVSPTRWSPPRQYRCIRYRAGYFANVSRKCNTVRSVCDVDTYTLREYEFNHRVIQLATRLCAREDFTAHVNRAILLSFRVRFPDGFGCFKIVSLQHFGRSKRREIVKTSDFYNFLSSDFPSFRIF